MEYIRCSSRNHVQISNWWSTSIPSAQRNGLSLSNKKDNLDSGNIVLQYYLGHSRGWLCALRNLVRPSPSHCERAAFCSRIKIFLFELLYREFAHYNRIKTVCMEYKNESGNFRKERMTRNSAWLPVFAVPSYGNYSFCSCNPLGQSFVNFLS